MSPIMKILKKSLTRFPRALPLLIILITTVKALAGRVANLNSKSFRTSLSANKFFYNGQFKIVRKRSTWKIWIPEKYTTDLKDEEDLLEIKVKATYPLYVYFENGIDSVNYPYALQKRRIQNFWNQSSYSFYVELCVRRSFLVLKNNSFEFRSNIYPFFGISVRYYFNKSENTISISTHSKIPAELRVNFDQLAQKNKTEHCEAYLIVQQIFDPQEGVFKRKYSCYFEDGKKGLPGASAAERNEVYINRHHTGKVLQRLIKIHSKCIVWCMNDTNCNPEELWAPRNQWSINSFCVSDDDELSKNIVYFPPVYVSLPQGRYKQAEIYFDIEDIKMESMIRMNPFDKYHQNGTVMNITCTISEAVAGTPFRIALKSNSSPKLKFLAVSHLTSFSSEDYSRSIMYKFQINKVNIERIFCFAPVLGSFEWINASRPIHIIVPSAPMFHYESKSNKGTLKTRVSTFNVLKQFKAGAKNEALLCNATGEPSPEISWTWNKQNVPESKGERKPHLTTWSQLWFPNVEKTIEGEYICKATNGLGVVTASFKVVVVDDFDPTVAITVSILLLVVAAATIAIVIKTRICKRSTAVLTKKDCQDFLHGNKETNNSDPNSEIFSRAFDPKYIIDKNNLEFNTEDILGSGQYGIVMKGLLTNEHKDVEVVAIKTTKKDVDIMYVKALLSEIQIMAYIGGHRNIAGLLGVCINGLREGKIYAAVEFCEKGDLLRCLQSHRTLLISSVEINDDACSLSYQNIAEATRTQGNSNLPFKLRMNMLQWSRDIACGMAFISSKNVIHGDLAARNVLLTKDNVAKISDFGLSRQLLNDYSVYTQKTLVPLPWKWMALESLKSSIFSVQSDVWAFGVTLWEIFSLGSSPFPGFHYDEEFIQKLTTGTRPMKPEFANDEIYKIMESCWNRNPEMRPHMSDVYDQFSQQLVNLSAAEEFQTSQPNYLVLEDRG